jgi:hypothetical protein
MPNNESATTQPPIGTTQFPLDDFRAELADLFQTQSFVTTKNFIMFGCRRVRNYSSAPKLSYSHDCDGHDSL